MHGDLLMLMSNPLFDDELNLVGVLDWEWSFVVPLQMLAPPVWPSGGDPKWMLIGTNLFYNEVSRLVAAVRDRERALQVPPRLSQDWTKSEAWCQTYDAYWDFVFYEAEEPRPEEPDFDFRAFYMRAIHPRLTTFVDTPERRALLVRKEEEQTRF